MQASDSHQLNLSTQKGISPRRAGKERLFQEKAGGKTERWNCKDDDAGFIHTGTGGDELLKLQFKTSHSHLHRRLGHTFAA